MTAEKLLDGASLRVVLHPDPEIQTDFPDLIESFDLPHVLIDGGNFIGKTRDRHALPHDYLAKEAFDPHFAASYAYANYLSLVINCSPAAGLFRAYDARSYLDVTFQTIPNHATVWEHGRDTSVAAVEQAIGEGRLLRIALLDSDGFWNIHPVDMSSFYIGKNFFELFTEQDSIPLLFRFPSTLREFEKTRLDQLAAAGHDPSAKAAFNLSMHVNPVEFYSSYYTVRSNGEYLRGAWVGGAESPSRYVSLKVFAEIW